MYMASTFTGSGFFYEKVYMICFVMIMIMLDYEDAVW